MNMGEDLGTRLAAQFTITRLFTPGAETQWGGSVSAVTEGGIEYDRIKLHFCFHGRLKEREALRVLAEQLAAARVEWLRPATTPTSR
ncbi:MAG TPA: hypothetical protein VEA69_19070 [Tepidisphaeraceae bacterium]|nr:hypothetical protein [Tepidisphaeraceae bacterium]